MTQPVTRNPVMLKNYLRIALRNLRKHPAYTVINVVGLAVGMACCLLILLYVRDELSYDRFHANAHRVYRVINTRFADGEAVQRASTPPAMGPTLVSEFPEVLAAVRVFDMGKSLVTYEDRQFFEPNVVLADSTLFEVFTFPLVKGDPATALSAPYGLLVTETMARKYFGDEEPIGKTLRVGDDLTFQVTGVLRDLPAQSHLRPDFIGSFATLQEFVPPERLRNWIWQQFTTYVLLPEGRDAAALEAKLPAFIARYATPETSAAGFRYETSLQPLTDVYLRSAHLRFDGGQRGNILYVYLFSATALIILVIACFNFTNLSTARAMQRAREVGIRKVVGARREQLVRQFLGEAVLLALLAVVLAVGLAYAGLPVLNTFSGKRLGLGLGAGPLAVLGLLGAGVLVGVAAGSYPAFVLSAFQPIRVLKGTAGPEQAGHAALRKALVVVQFAISIVLIVGTAVIYRQLDYMKHTQMGFDEEQVVVVPIRGERMSADLETFKAELLRHPGVVAAAGSWGIPGDLFAGDDIRLPGREAAWGTNMFTVDFDYLETYGMRLAAGRGFSEAYPSDADRAFVLNETAARALGWTPEEALGKEIWWNIWGTETDTLKKGNVIGVVEDFHYQSLHQPIDPLVLHIFPPAFGHVSVRIQPDDVAGTLALLERTWGAWVPDWPFDYFFLDENLDAAYKAEEKVVRLAGVFAGLAILVACLGLFGLASFAAERRTKEVGIRKVLGATVPGLVLLFWKEFARLVLVAFVVAVPFAYFGMSQWLERFAFRVEIGPAVFVLGGVLALGIALLTVSYQAARAALTDPVRSLRYE